jgi:4-hydroxythreonine-4-phosphate dehydrogenase
MESSNIMKSNPIIGITVGDPAGVGPEIVIKSLVKHKLNSRFRLIIFADHIVIKQALEQTGLSLNINGITHPDECVFKAGIVNFVDSKSLGSPVNMGIISGENGRSVFRQVSDAIDWAMKGLIDAIATAPLQKESLRQGGCPYLDHTEILKALSGAEDATTLFMTDGLRVFFLTRHLPLKKVSAAITAKGLMQAIPRCLKYLAQLGMDDPLLAVAALNPHGGEEGLFGTEERDIIIPAIRLARSLGHRVDGPIPADSVFHLAHSGQFDGVLSLYHDQGHIATKTLGFYRTVSLTLGLPFLRTSVDHGTAFNIAGRNQAIETSMVEAISYADRYAYCIKRPGEPHENTSIPRI